MAVFVICSNTKCEGPGVAEYGDDYVAAKPIEEHFCGFCSHAIEDKDGNRVGVNRVPMREATAAEIADYQSRRKPTFEEALKVKRELRIASIQQRAKAIVADRLKLKGKEA